MNVEKTCIQVLSNESCMFVLQLTIYFKKKKIGQNDKYKINKICEGYKATVITRGTRFAVTEGLKLQLLFLSRPLIFSGSNHLPNQTQKKMTFHYPFSFSFSIYFSFVSL